MKLKALKSFRHGTKNYRRDAPVDVSDAVGRDLIKRGYAQEAGAKKAAKPEIKAAPAQKEK